MAFISSPIQYPATSSPREQESPRKRRRIEKDDQREPLATIENSRATVGKRTIGGFVDGDDSEDEDQNIQRSQYDELSRNETRFPSIDDIEQNDTLLPKRKDTSDTRQDSGYETASSPPPYSQSASLSQSRTASLSNPQATARNTSNNTIPLKPRRKNPTTHYSSIVASRSTHAPGKAQKSYYGIDIHNLLAESNNRLRAAEAAGAKLAGAEDAVLPSVEDVTQGGSRKALLWTEKYRAKKFTDLLGDERTHRSVLKWLKGWDGIVFHTAPAQSKSTKGPQSFGQKSQEEERPHRKILLLTGPPGLGKTTLAHVCARQAGYETHEINASDERSKDVVKNRIRDMVGTENVRGSSAGKKSAKPVCVVVDEVDGVVSSGGGGGAGEGGFVRALIDLLMLDQRNSNRPSYAQGGGKKKGDQFRLLRPIVLVCNDSYAPALRLLRQGNIAEIVHVRKPTLQAVVPRLHKIFEREGVPADSDAVRTLCESAWGVTSRRQGGKGGGGHSEGDVRALLVAGEWVAGKLREANTQGGMEQVRLTRRWIEKNVLAELAHGGGMAKNLGRGDVRDIVERVFKYNAGFSSASVTTAGQKASKDDIYGKHAAIGVAEASKRNAMDRLREMVEASGDEDKVMLGECHTFLQSLTALASPILTESCRLLYHLPDKIIPRHHSPLQTQPRLRLDFLPQHPHNPRAPTTGMGSGSLPQLSHTRLPQPLFLLLQHALRSQQRRQRLRRNRQTRPSSPYPSRRPPRLRNTQNQPRAPNSLTNPALNTAPTLLPLTRSSRHRTHPIYPPHPQPYRKTRPHQRYLLHPPTI